MKTIARVFLLSACSVFMALPIRAGEGSLSLLGAYGLSDGYNAGFGLRGAFELSDGWHLGAHLVYHLGESEDFSVGGITVSTGINMYYTGAELAHDLLKTDAVNVRAYGGLGAAFFRTSSTGAVPEVSETETRLFAAPGLQSHFDISTDYFAGLDVRYMLISGDAGKSGAGAVAMIFIGLNL